MPQAMNYQDALKYSMNLCSKSERCRSEVRDKLTGFGVREPDIEKVLAALEKEKFIDEARYASMFAADKLRFNKWGKIKIRYILNQKKIPPELITQAMDDMDPVQYEEILKQELLKKMKTLRTGSPWEKRNQLFRFASQRGFDSDLIRKVLDTELS
jgi:regulatory protein